MKSGTPAAGPVAPMLAPTVSRPWREAGVDEADAAEAVGDVPGQPRPSTSSRSVLGLVAAGEAVGDALARLPVEAEAAVEVLRPGADEGHDEAGR